MVLSKISESKNRRFWFLEKIKSEAVFMKEPAKNRECENQFFFYSKIQKKINMVIFWPNS